jgi:hypothetical protein
MPRVLIGCEFSGIVRDAFAAIGWDAWSCDLLPTERPGNHITGDVLAILGDNWDLAIFHPPCTYLTNAGVRHLHDNVTSINGVKAKVSGAARFEAMREAAAFFNALKSAPIPRKALENPTPHKYARALIGDYQQAFQPWEFGEPETKRTCLWLHNLPPLMATIIETKRYPKCHMTSPGPNRWKERSRTLAGVARAMAAQWSTL